MAGPTFDSPSRFSTEVFASDHRCQNCPPIELTQNNPPRRPKHFPLSFQAAVILSRKCRPWLRFNGFCQDFLVRPLPAFSPLTWLASKFQHPCEIRDQICYYVTIHRLVLLFGRRRWQRSSGFHYAPWKIGWQLESYPTRKLGKWFPLTRKR